MRIFRYFIDIVVILIKRKVCKEKTGSISF